MSTPTDQERQQIASLRIARALAIEHYARLEHSLCSLFAILLSSPIDKAAIVFFKLSNFRARNSIISELFDKHFRGRYDAFWNGTPHNNKQDKKPGL